MHGMVPMPNHASNHEPSDSRKEMRGGPGIQSSQPLRISRSVLASLDLWYECMALVLAKDGLVQIIDDDGVCTSEQKLNKM